MPRLVDDEFDRAAFVYFGRLDQPHGRVAHRGARFRRDARAGAFFDQLLVPPLHAAIALPQMHDVAVMIGQHLHFDVPRMLDVFFEIDVAVAERRLGLGPRLLQRRLERQVVRRHAHAAPAAAGRPL